MKLDPNGQYTMPAHFGQTFTRGQPKYPDVLTMQVSYVTDRALLAQYLPTPFEVGKEAVMSVSYSMNREIEWLAGGSYNIVGVNAATVFNGSVDQLSGNYCLVMWENLTDPILAGREIQGIPKIYGDIEDHRIVEGIWRTSVSHRGHKILDMRVGDLTPLSAAELSAVENLAQQDHWMGWKYIPNENLQGATVSHATLFPKMATFREGWTGIGNVQWHRLTWEQNPMQAHIVNALASLPVLETRSALVLRGSIELGVSGVRKLQ